MSGKPSTSRERIIPIEMEADDNSVEDNKKVEMESEEPSTTEVQGGRTIPVEIEEDIFSDECKEEEPVSSSYAESDNRQEDSNNHIVENTIRTNNLPMFNVKEKIILVLDSAKDEIFTSFLLNNGQKNKPLDMLKHAVQVFLNHKQLINKKHEYALVVMNANNVDWVVNFTNEKKDILRALEEIDSCQTEDIFQLSSLFNVISEKVEIPALCTIHDIIFPPPYIVRTILLYGRSYTMPTLLKNKNIQQLLESPYFILDVLMTHEPIDDNNNCNKIFNVLQNLDTKGYSYFLPVGRDAKALISSMGKLLGHPLQRPRQELANYSIKNN